MGSKKESSVCRNIFQTTQANINTPRNLFGARHPPYQGADLSHGILWENAYIDPGCLNNYQRSWYGSKYGLHSVDEDVSNSGSNNYYANHLNTNWNYNGGFLCSSDVTKSSSASPRRNNSENSMETNDFSNFCIENNNPLDLTPSISTEYQQNAMNSMITDLKDDVDHMTVFDDPNDILSKLNSNYVNEEVDSTWNYESMDQDINITGENYYCDFDSNQAVDEFLAFQMKKDGEYSTIISDLDIDRDFNIPSIKCAVKENQLDDDTCARETMDVVLEEIPENRPTTDKGIVETTENIYDNSNHSDETVELIETHLENVEQYFDENGDTELHAAIHRQNINEALQVLQRPEASIIKDLRNNSKEVPILLALKRFANECSLLLENLLLLRTNVNVEDQNGNNIFHLILLQTRCEENCLTLLNMLFQHDENKESYKVLMSKRNVDGYCATHFATSKRYNKVIALMHKHGADLNVQENKGQRTCVIIAAEDENWDLVRELIDMSVNINLPTNAKIRAVNYAIKFQQIQMIELFFKHGTDVYKWKDRNTPKEIVVLVEKLIRKKRRQRQKKDTQVERPA